VALPTAHTRCYGHALIAVRMSKKGDMIPLASDITKTLLPLILNRACLSGTRSYLVASSQLGQRAATRGWSAIKNERLYNKCCRTSGHVSELCIPVAVLCDVVAPCTKKRPTAMSWGTCTRKDRYPDHARTPATPACVGSCS